MWEPDYDKQAKYWMEKDAVSNKLDPEKLKKRIDSFICERKNLYTGYGYRQLCQMYSD